MSLILFALSVWRYPPRVAPTHTFINLLTILFTSRWSTSGPIGVTHISCHYKNTIEGTGENKTNEQTRTICLGLTQDVTQGSMQHYNFDSIYGLTLAWVTSENSTKQLECRLILTRSSSLSLDPISCWLASLLRCPVSTALVRVPSPTASRSFVQPTLFSRPVTTSGHAEISIPKPFVWFRAKTDKGIVCLAGHLHSVTPEGKLRPHFALHYRLKTTSSSTNQFSIDGMRKVSKISV